MKRSLFVTICLLLALSFVLSGCAQTGAPQGSAGASSAAARSAGAKTAAPAKAYSDPGVFPVSKDPVTLKFTTKQHPAVIDFNTNEFSKYMESVTGVKVQWDTIPQDASGGTAEKLNLILASGTYPDAFFGLGISDSVMTQYGTTEKVFQPIETVIDSEAVELTKIFNEIPGSREEITSLDGHIYSMPEVNQCYHCTYQTKMWVNQTWLDKLGLKVPTTTDEFYAMLKAFKTGDPNGNGKADELPMAGAQKNGWENEIDKFLMNAFCYYDLEMYDTKSIGVMGLYMKDGKVVTPYDDPAMKEGLKYLNKLYAEGLIYEGSFTQDNTQLTQLVENPDAELVGAIPSGYGGMFAQLGADRYKQFVCIAPLKGPGGVQYANTFPYEGVYGGGFVITKDCNTPEIAVKWADYLYTFDATTRLTRGVVDKDWRLPKDGELGINGKPALYVPLTPWDEAKPQNDSFIQVGITKRDNDYRLGEFMAADVDMTSGDGLEKLLYTVSKELYEPYAQNDKAMPHLKFTKEENDELMTLIVEYAKYARQTITDFVIGKLSVDKDWDNFTQNLEKLQMKRIVEIYQTAYDRQFK